jgi:hypothetical protein
VAQPPDGIPTRFEACGLNGKHDLDRSAVRHGIGNGSVTLGGRRVGQGVQPPRPRARVHNAKHLAAQFEKSHRSTYPRDGI